MRNRFGVSSYLPGFVSDNSSSVSGVSLSKRCDDLLRTGFARIVAYLDAVIF